MKVRHTLIAVLLGIVIAVPSPVVFAQQGMGPLEAIQGRWIVATDGPGEFDAIFEVSEGRATLTSLSDDDEDIVELGVEAGLFGDVLFRHTTPDGREYVGHVLFETNNHALLWWNWDDEGTTMHRLGEVSTDIGGQWVVTDPARRGVNEITIDTASLTFYEDPDEPLPFFGLEPDPWFAIVGGEDMERFRFVPRPEDSFLLFSDDGNFAVLHREGNVPSWLPELTWDERRDQVAVDVCEQVRTHLVFCRESHCQTYPDNLLCSPSAWAATEAMLEACDDEIQAAAHGILTLECDELFAPLSVEDEPSVRDVSSNLIELDDGVFRLDVTNPNDARVGARFRIRTYRYDSVPPETELVHVYVAPNDVTSHNIHTGGCDAVPPPESGSIGGELIECQLRVTATLLETYYLAAE